MVFIEYNHGLFEIEAGNNVEKIFKKLERIFLFFHGNELVFNRKPPVKFIAISVKNVV